MNATTAQVLRDAIDGLRDRRVYLSALTDQLRVDLAEDERKIARIDDEIADLEASFKQEDAHLLEDKVARERDWAE